MVGDITEVEENARKLAAQSAKLKGKTDEGSGGAKKTTNIGGSIDKETLKEMYERAKKVFESVQAKVKERSTKIDESVTKGKITSEAGERERKKYARANEYLAQWPKRAQEKYEDKVADLEGKLSAEQQQRRKALAEDFHRAQSAAVAQ